MKHEKGINLFIEKTLLFCAFFSILVTFLIVSILIIESIPFFKEVSIIDFLIGINWSPSSKNPSYGILPLLCGTFMIVFLSMIIAIPLGIGAAIYTSEYTSYKKSRLIKSLLEILAGIPSVIYGFFALKYITPFIKIFVPDVSIFNALSASIAVGIMIIPTIASISEDALRSVPSSLKEAGYGLGLTKKEVILGIIIPTSISGIISSFILGISRAVGETMIVAIAAGATPTLILNPFQSIQTMTGCIINIVQGEVVVGSIEYRAIYAISLTLFLITLFLNFLARKIILKFNNRYKV